MLGRITIYVDSEIVTSFVSELDEWYYRQSFIIPRLHKLQLAVGHTPEAQVLPLKTLLLKVSANLYGNVNGIFYLCLFCYNYDDPTLKQEQLDVQMAQGQMRNLL